MNDDTDKPLNTVGDDALEARITAWVLGEASSFEAGELEKLCAADPALGLFERRLRALHGLVAEDFKAGPAAEWKLSVARRAKITDLLGVEPAVVEKIAARRRKSRGPSMRGLILALAACVVLGFISISLIRGVGKSAKFETYSMMAESQVKASASERAAARDEALAELGRAVVRQKDLVEDKRKLLSQIIRQEGIIYNGDRTDGRGLDASDEAEVAAREYNRLDREKIQLESQIETLLKYDGPQLMNYAAGLNLPQNAIPEKLPLLQEAKREFDALKSSGLGQGHPDLVAKGRELNAMEAEVGQEVAELRDTLKAKLELTKEQVSRLRIKEITERMQSKITEDAVVLNDVHPAMELATAERSSGAPAKKPDSAYSHLATNSAFTSKPPPASVSAARPAEPASRPASEAQALANNEAPPAEKAKGSDEELSDHAVGYVGGGAVGGRGAEAAPEVASRSNRDFIPMVEGVTIPGIPAATGATVTDIITAGNRSGDAAITRNNIDAVLNNPDRAAGTKQEGEGAAALTGTFSDEAIAQVDGKLAERAKLAPPASRMTKAGAGTLGIDAIPADPAGPAEVEGKDEAAKAWTGSFRSRSVATDEKAMEELSGKGRIAGAVESEGTTRGPETGKLTGWLVAGEADEAGFGGGGGMPQELQAGTPLNINGVSESRFKANLRAGSEVDLGRGDASNFGDLDAMERLAGEAKPQQDLGYFDSKSASQVVDGIADLSALARKQRESRVDAGNPGQGFGLTAPAGGVAATGGLKRDLSVDPFAEQAPAIPAPAATGDFDGFVNEGAPIQSEIANESQEARFRGVTETTAGVLKAKVLTKKVETVPGEPENDARARILEEVDKAWELSVPPVDGPVVTDAARGNLRNDLTKAADGNYNSLAQKEMIRRQSAVATSDKLRDDARTAYAAGNYRDAVAKYKESLTVLPDASMVEDRRKFLEDSLGDAAVALSDEYRKVGKYEEARQLASETLAKDANNADAKRVLEYLEDPIRTSPALTYEHAQNVDEVRRKLYIAEGSHNLGKHDEARRVYEDVLRIDPYNKAARRGMEKVAQARSDYYRAAYDHTRAQLLAEVDKAWELSVPPVVGGPQIAGGNALIVEKRESIIIPEINFVDTTVEEALDFLRVRALEIDAELDPAKKGVNLVLAMPPADSGLANPATLKIKSLQMKNATLDDVIDEIARATGLEVAIADHAVVLRTGARSPSKAEQIVDLMSETLAADEPFSTFSLHVSDASFKLAQAAMERGEVPAAEGIRPEEFYNAFDYGDPAPANGEPVVCVTEQSAHPAFAQRNLLRIGVRTGSQGRGASTPLNLTLLLDHSGSMEREDRNAGLAMAVRQLSGLLKEGDTITVAGFSRQPRLLADRLPGARAQELNELIARTPSEGGTNLEEGLKLGEELAKRQFNPAAQNRVVLFTDGAANLGDARPEALQARIEGLRQQGIAFDAAGFGADGLNDKLLERLTRNGNGRYYVVDGPEDADAGFAKQLAGAFRPAAENVKVQVRFNPARVAKYKLIGFEEHRLKKEDFRNDTVDAAEMAAEEAGNALYQIETLPQGEGEVGEVSVRFRDVASGQMVERTWTIPYDAQAPAFDRATPSIQLAGLAAFTAEKLRAAPMADAVDFQQLGQVYAGVRARYPNSQPVADLGSMIGKMK